jgi:hypothetical protein
MTEDVSAPEPADVARLRAAIKAGGELVGATGGGAIGLIGGIEGGVWKIAMASWRLTASGQLLADLTRLDDVPDAERSSVLSELLAA